MSGPRITDAAVDAGARALHYIEHGPWISGLGIEPGGTPWGTSRELARRDEYRAHATEILTAALPHIRRAVIEELIEKAEARPLPKYARWLRAELEGDDRG